jgi:hypothetical protein
MQTVKTFAMLLLAVLGWTTHTPLTWAVTFADPPLYPEITYAPMMQARIKAPVLAERQPDDPVFRTVIYPQYARTRVVAKPMLRSSQAVPVFVPWQPILPLSNGSIGSATPVILP